jgi:hypothetical protein
VTDMNEAIRRRLAGRAPDDEPDRSDRPAAPDDVAPVVPGGVRTTAVSDRPAVTLGDVIRGHLAAEAERRGSHVRTAHTDRTARRSVDEDEA